MVFKSKDLLSIVAIAKNEGAYIKEWIEYHRLAGVDRIYLYDNESSDNLEDIIKSYIDSEFVIYKKFPGKGVQLEAYNDALKYYSNKSKYMAFIDCDEFLVSRDSESLGKLVDRLLKSTGNFFASGLAVNWCVFGSSGHEIKPKGLVIENYLYHARYENGNGNNVLKTIVKPERVWKFNSPHFPRYLPLFYSVDEEGRKITGWDNKKYKYKYLQLNHYFTKSKEEWIERRSYGKADFKNDEKRTMKEFYQHDCNEEYDGILLSYVDDIKKNIK